MFLRSAIFLLFWSLSSASIFDNEENEKKTSTGATPVAPTPTLITTPPIIPPATAPSLTITIPPVPLVPTDPIVPTTPVISLSLSPTNKPSSAPSKRPSSAPSRRPSPQPQSGDYYVEVSMLPLLIAMGAPFLVIFLPIILIILASGGCCYGYGGGGGGGYYPYLEAYLGTYP